MMRTSKLEIKSTFVTGRMIQSNEEMKELEDR